MGCAVGLGCGKGEDPDPVLPTSEKESIGLVVAVPVVVGRVGWLVGIKNVGTGVAVVLEKVGVDGGGAADLKKLGTTVLAVLVEGSGFVVGTDKVVVVGLEKKLGNAFCAGTGFEAAGVWVGTANRFFAGSLVSVAVTLVIGFDCTEAMEAGVDKHGIVVLVVGVVIAGAGTGAGDGFFLSSAAFCVSRSFCLIFNIASASISCFSHFENDLTCFNRGESKPTATRLL